MRALLAYDWPGNVRELEHAIEHAVLVADSDEIKPEDLPPRVQGSGAAGAGGHAMLSGAYREARRAFEDEPTPRLMRAGDFVDIAPHRRHRVESTTAPTLWLAVRSFKIIACILVTLFVGLSITMAAGLARSRRELRT